MKKTVIIALAISFIFFTNCDKEEQEEELPILPPIGSMQLDLSVFNTNKQGELYKSTGTKWNIVTAWSTVTVWNTVLVVGLYVPVSAFAYAHEQEPVYNASEKLWEWKYNVAGHSVRLTGKVEGTNVLWKLYVTKSGVYENFLWYEGKSAINRASGSWTLYHSYVHNQKWLEINWTATADSLASVKYMNVMDKWPDGAENVHKGSNIEYGYNNTENYNAYYNLYGYNDRDSTFKDARIEVNTSTKEGRVWTTDWGQDAWRCWDENGFDIQCK